MKRSRSRLALALATALLLGAAATPALAEWKLDAVYYAPNSTTAVFKDGDRECHVTYTGPNNPYTIVYYDTGPDDTGEKGAEKPDVVSLLRHSKVQYEVTLTPERTPLVKWIDRSGFGFAPHGNPGDTDTGNGPPQLPKRNEGSEHNQRGLTDKQLAGLDKLFNVATRAQQIINAGMGSGDEGGAESWPGLDKRGGDKTGFGTSNNSDNKNRYFPSGEVLGPRPDLVNPPYRARVTTKAATAKVTTRTTSNVGTSSSGAARSSVIGAGLLESGGAFATQGPSAAGTRIGTGSGAHGPSAAGIH